MIGSELLYTEEFDEDFKKIPHYVQYPQMLPFVGREWGKSRMKILLVGESHYIDGECLAIDLPEKDYENDWYELDSKLFSDYLANYIRTRGAVNAAENPEISKSTLNIFYNMADVARKGISSLQSEPHIFPYFSFYNYFQRPAFSEGDSIINSGKDNDVAYETLTEIVKIIKPSGILFASSKAHDAFRWYLNSDKGDDIFKHVLSDYSPHPGCAWWNTEAKKYGLRSNGNGYRTGREKFADILDHMVNTINSEGNAVHDQSLPSQDLR